MNNKFIKKNIEDITVNHIKKAIEFSKKTGHKDFAPLGCGGDNFMLYGESRRKEISVRLHSGDVKLLITDNVGNFLFYGGFDMSLLPVSFISKEYFRIIQLTKHLLENTSKSNSISEDDKEKMFEAAIVLSQLTPNLSIF